MEYITDIDGTWSVRKGKKYCLIEPSAEYLTKNTPTEEQKKELENNKILLQLKALDNPRDAEDLFNILKSKGILSDADLPTQTLERYNSKKDLRNKLK